MPKYRHHLPQLDRQLFLSDSGLETTLVFHQRRKLPLFAAFDLLATDEGYAALKRYYQQHAAIAVRHSLGFILESATWRASRDWGGQLGYTPESLQRANRRAIALLTEVREELETDRSPMVVSGCVGPRGDGYAPGDLMTVDEAKGYHAAQIQAFVSSEADLVTAITMTNAPEATGFALAACDTAIPSVISFTVETDGRLPTGQTLQHAIEEVDERTDAAPAYYMVNCAHPTHFGDALRGGKWVNRIRGIRANASRCSHAELDAAESLDDGDPVELGEQYAEIRARLPHINVLGGCCGTDHRHIDCIADACRSTGAPAVVLGAR